MMDFFLPLNVYVLSEFTSVCVFFFFFFGFFTSVFIGYDNGYKNSLLENMIGAFVKLQNKILLGSLCD